MSSQAITENDLAAILNGILPVNNLMQSWEYVGDVGSALFNGTWTAPYDGMLVIRGVANTSGSLAYWYIKDTTDNSYLSMLCWDSANGTSRSSSFPVIKGHIYSSPGKSAISEAYGHFFKPVLKEAFDIRSNTVLLFDNDANELTTSSVTLSESAANFDMLTICYKTNDGDYSSVNVYRPNGKTATLWGSLTSGATTYMKSRVVAIQDTTITNANGGQLWLSGSSSYNSMSGDYIAVTQVIGHRLVGMDNATNPRIFVSPNAPASTDGKNGDIWIKYTEPTGGE